MEQNWTYKIDCRNMETNQIIDAILKDRGIKDFKSFFYPTEENIIPFEKMKNIDEAAQVVINAIDANMVFAVYYDVDLDGCSSGSIAEKWLKSHGINVVSVINNGKEHGVAHADLDILKNVDVLWIVDSIESNIESYERIIKNGIKHIVITDHHIIEKSLQKDMERTGKITLVSSAVDYENPELSGSGVTWKLCQYIDWLELDDYSDDLTDLAACGIIGDMTSVGKDSMENRYICYKGFNNRKNFAIEKISGSYGFNSQSVSYSIAPLVNAANRTNNNDLAKKVFSIEDEKEVKKIISELKQCKDIQNDEVSDLLLGIEEQAQRQINNKVMFFIVDTYNDVKGLLGNKLIEKYKRPVIIVSIKTIIDEDTGEVEKMQYTGSARAVGVENFKLIVDNTGLAETGGHENAFGIWFDFDNMEELSQKLEEELQNVEFVQNEVADILITEDQINNNLIDQIKKLNNISGKNWAPIKVMIKNVKNYEIGMMSGGKHLKLIANCGKLLYIKWNYRYDQFPGGEISVIGGLDSGFFGRTFYQQVIINNWKLE